MAKKSVRKPRKQVLVSSAQINAFIKAHAHEEDCWQDLTLRILRELHVDITVSAVKNRGNSLKVKTKKLKKNGNSEQFKVVDPTIVKPNDPTAAKVLDAVRRRANLLTVEDLANLIDTSPHKVGLALEELKKGGHNIMIAAGGSIGLSRDIPKADPLRIDTRKLKGKVLRFGLTADNHLASKYERMDVLNALFDRWQEQGITTVYQAGNIIEGDARFNKYDTIVHGLEAQSRYLANNWPVRKGMTTYFITGDDHEGWYVQREGVEVGKYMEATCRDAGRNDLVYLGHMEHDIVLQGKKQKSVMRIIHAGGGSSYATSYAPQKIVESYQGGEKPHVLLVGHYHKAEYGYPREVHVVQAGCTCDQTPFMRKNKLQAHVGGWTIEITINDDGVITGFKQEWMPFFDKGFYTNAWNYKKLAA